MAGMCTLHRKCIINNYYSHAVMEFPVWGREAVPKNHQYMLVAIAVTIFVF